MGYEKGWREGKNRENKWVARFGPLFERERSDWNGRKSQPARTTALRNQDKSRPAVNNYNVNFQPGFHLLLSLFHLSHFYSLFSPLVSTAVRPLYFCNRPLHMAPVTLTRFHMYCISSMVFKHKLGEHISQFDGKMVPSTEKKHFRDGIITRFNFLTIAQHFFLFFFTVVSNWLSRNHGISQELQTPTFLQSGLPYPRQLLLDTFTQGSKKTRRIKILIVFPSQTLKHTCGVQQCRQQTNMEGHLHFLTNTYLYSHIHTLSAESTHFIGTHTYSTLTSSPSSLSCWRHMEQFILQNFSFFRTYQAKSFFRNTGEQRKTNSLL